MFVQSYAKSAVDRDPSKFDQVLVVYSKTVNRGTEKLFLNYRICVVVVVIVVVF